MIKLSQKLVLPLPTPDDIDHIMKENKVDTEKVKLDLP